MVEFGIEIVLIYEFAYELFFFLNRTASNEPIDPVIESGKCSIWINALMHTWMHIDSHLSWLVDSLEREQTIKTRNEHFL